MCVSLACTCGSPPRPPSERASKLRYECAILPMVADGNLLTVMALAAQHTRSFLFGHNCDEETPLFVSRGTSGKNETLRDNATSIMEAVSMQTGPDARTSARYAGQTTCNAERGPSKLNRQKTGILCANSADRQRRKSTPTPTLSAGKRGRGIV